MRGQLPPRSLNCRRRVLNAGGVHHTRSWFHSLPKHEKKKFKKVTRSDLIAGYLGQTALKTQEVIKECLGGVLFIDEAYALGNEQKKDSFAKECIDTLCEGLSDHKENLMVIIAGYEKELQSCFFDYNQGLESRFSWRLHQFRTMIHHMKAKPHVVRMDLLQELHH